MIDLTDVTATDASNHDKFAQLATVAPELRAVLEQGIGSKSGSEAAGENPLSGVVTLPASLLGAPVKITAEQ